MKEEFKIPETIVISTFYGIGGNECEESRCFAKHYSINDGNSYYVWFSRGLPHDPYGMDTLNRKAPYCKITKVPKEMFELYIKYLKTKNGIYLTLARRVNL